MKILFVFVILLLGFAIAEEEDDEEYQFAKGIIRTGFSIKPPTITISKPRTTTVTTITKTHVSMDTEFDSELESIEANRWKLQQMIESLTMELDALAVNLKILEAKQKTMSKSVHETETIITTIKFQREAEFKSSRSEITKYQGFVREDEHILRELRMKATKQNSELTILLKEIETHKSKMKHTKHLIADATILLGKAEFAVKAEENEVFILSNKIKAETKNLQMMKSELATRERFVKIAIGEVDAAENNVRIKGKLIVELEAKLHKHKQLLVVKEAKLKAARATLVQYELEVKKIMQTMEVMTRKISVMKVTIQKYVNLVANIHLMIGQAQKALMVAQGQYAAFQKTVASKKAELLRRRESAKMQMLKISKQESEIRRLEMLFKTKETKVSELRLLVTQRTRQVAQLRYLLTNQETHDRSLTIKLRKLRDEINSLQIRISKYLAQIRAGKMKIEFLKKTLRITVLKWKAELLVIRKKFKDLKTNDLELRARISRIKAYMAEKHTLKAQYQAEMSGMIKKIAVLRQQVEAIRQKKLAAKKASFAISFNKKMSIEGEEVRKEEFDEIFKE
jgi:chromosome segregation ATPase